MNEDNDKRYLAAISDWRTPSEVAALLGFTEDRAAGGVARKLSGLVARGLAEWRRPSVFRAKPKL